MLGLPQEAAAAFLDAVLCQQVRQSQVKDPVTLRGQRFVVRQVSYSPCRQ